MSDDADEMHARHLAILREFQADGVELARELKALAQEAIAARKLEAAERLALAWHRLTRSVRQSLALEAKFERDAKHDAEDRQLRRDLQTLVAKKKIRPHHYIRGRLVWH